jgi:Fe2+ transport system protein FeoA
LEDWEVTQLTTLDLLDPGQKAVVKKVGGDGPIRRRIQEMGVTNGAGIEMVKSSPLGDPIEYKVRGFNLALRKEEARMIEVEI